MSDAEPTAAIRQGWDAWYQLSEEEQNSQNAKVQEALEKVGGKSILTCVSSWSSEQWLGFGVEEFPVINNHLTSRSGSTPVFGGHQPFVQAGEDEREAQMQALNEYVDFLLDKHDDARIVVLGDLNTFEFTNDLTEILPGTGSEKVLSNLIDSLLDDNVYTYNFEGNSQVLDHFLVSDALLGGAELDIVRVNVDFPRVDDTVGSDHEPLVALLNLDDGDH